MSNTMLKKYAIVLLIFISCARQVGPNGGPEDKTPPSVINSKPAIGAVNYPVKSSVTFYFSEWLDKKTAEKCVSVFPVPLHGIKIKASGKTIEVRASQAFAESTTYHIEFGASLKDLHGNSIGIPYHFFFSTGPTIDSGKISGCVVSAERAGQPKAALFWEKSGALPDSVLFGIPNYVVQTDSFGHFSFDHIRKGKYSLIAFLDANNDNRLQPAIENAYAPMEKSVLTDSESQLQVLYPVGSDTMRNRIISLKQLSNFIVMGSWAREADTISAATLSKWRIDRIGDTPAVCRIKEYLPLPQSSKFFLTLTDTINKAAYRILYAAVLKDIAAKSPQLDSARLEGCRIVDTIHPKVTGFYPMEKAGLKTHIKLTWSEPVTCRASSWKLIDSLGDTVPVSMTTTLCDTTFFVLKRSLKPDRIYSLDFPDTLFSDAAGNNPVDSLFGRYLVKTISAENICYSLSGGASCLKKTALAKWIFMPFGSIENYTVSDSSGRFRFDSLPSGKGRIGYFIDCNNDNKPTKGNLVPWVKPEPYTIFPDTVEARARWDIEGIEVAGCEACAQKKPPVDSLASSGQHKKGKSNLLQKMK